MNDSFGSQAAGYLEMSHQWEKSEKEILKYLFGIERISLQNKNDFRKYLKTFKFLARKIWLLSDFFLKK